LKSDFDAVGGKGRVGDAHVRGSGATFCFQR